MTTLDATSSTATQNARNGSVRSQAVGESLGVEVILIACAEA